MILATAAWFALAVSPWIRLLRHWGGVGLLALGVRGTVLPLPAGIEFATVILAARHRDLWWYYGLMATAGSCVSGAFFYYLGWTGGTQLLKRRISAKQTAVWMNRLQSWGFGVVALSGIIPPPLPMAPMLIAAGAARYPRGRFTAALVLGRLVRFMALGLLGNIYRRRAVAMINRMILPLIVLTIVGFATYAFLVWLKVRNEAARQATAVPDAPDTEASLAMPQSSTV